MQLPTKLSVLIICLGLFTTSCTKEEITPNNPTQTETETTSPNIETQSFELQNSFSSSGDFSIEISKTTCTTGGYTLTVSSPDVDLSNGDYIINWYKNTEQVILSTGIDLECVCGFGIRVEILNLAGEIEAKDSLDIPGC
ncbi:MAG: hypothetical protein AB8H03_05825 [Saprospiraceae bacterium]